MRSEDKLEVRELERRRERRGFRVRLHVVQDPASHLVSCGRSALNELSASSAGTISSARTRRKISESRCGRSVGVLIHRLIASNPFGVTMYAVTAFDGSPIVTPSRYSSFGELLRVVVDRRLPVAADTAQTRPDQKLDLVRVCAIDNVVLAAPSSRSRRVRAAPSGAATALRARPLPHRSDPHQQALRTVPPVRSVPEAETLRNGIAKSAPDTALLRNKHADDKACPTQKCLQKATSWSATRQLQVGPRAEPELWVPPERGGPTSPRPLTRGSAPTGRGDRAYREAGVEGPLPSGPPTDALGRHRGRPGYPTLGRLHAIGYVRASRGDWYGLRCDV